MIAPLALALLVAAEAPPDLHVTSAEAGRAVGDPPAAEVILREADVERTWFSPLSRAEALAEVAVLGLGLVDWGQTIRFTQRGAYAAYEESNPILGPHPSRARVNAYFPLALALHALAAWALPPPYRNVLQLGGIALEVNAVASNADLGIAPAAPWQ